MNLQLTPAAEQKLRSLGNKRYYLTLILTLTWLILVIAAFAVYMISSKRSFAEPQNHLVLILCILPFFPLGAHKVLFSKTFYATVSYGVHGTQFESLKWASPRNRPTKAAVLELTFKRADGKEIMRIYKGGAYITLEEVAAYMYAFGGASGSLPANYTASKKTRPSESIWGEYLRVNHSKFSGNTKKYPYEPELPDISGCGGALQYYEMDIGTTGTQTPGGYAVKTYNDGTVITRGAARLVYARQDKNGNGIFEPDEVHVFYTDNHYNDFREYLNYYGGWGQIFGNVTGGGEYSSKTNCNPTPYPATAYEEFVSLDQAA